MGKPYCSHCRKEKHPVTDYFEIVGVAGSGLRLRCKICGHTWTSHSEAVFRTVQPPEPKVESDIDDSFALDFAAIELQAKASQRCPYCVNTDTFPIELAATTFTGGRLYSRAASDTLRECPRCGCQIMVTKIIEQERNDDWFSEWQAVDVRHYRRIIKRTRELRLVPKRSA